MPKKIVKNQDQLMPFDIHKWRKSREVSALDEVTRMVWLEILFCMWQSEERGYLTINHQPILILEPSVRTDVQTPVRTLAIAVAIPGVIPCVEPLLKECINKMYLVNTFSIRKDGVMFCRDMVRQVSEKTLKSKAGKASYEKRHNNFNFPVQTPVQTVVQTPVQTPVQTVGIAPAIEPVELLLRARITTTNTIDTIDNGSISSSILSVRTPVRTEESGYHNEIYIIDTGNQHLPHPINVCFWNYFNNPNYQQTRGLHCIRLNLDSDPIICLDKLIPWANAFNRGLINDGKLTCSMLGGSESWLNYFPNWAKKVIEKRGYINPNILFTKDDVKISENLTIKQKKEAFKTSLDQYIEKYDRKMMNAFFKHWAEPNTEKTLLRWEMEKTWEASMRLSAWHEKDLKFSKA